MDFKVREIYIVILKYKYTLELDLRYCLKGYPYNAYEKYVIFLKNMWLDKL